MVSKWILRHNNLFLHSTLKVCVDTAYYWKLKIYYWKHCNKIIFKLWIVLEDHVNNVVFKRGSKNLLRFSVFMGVVNSAQDLRKNTNANYICYPNSHWIKLFRLYHIIHWERLKIKLTCQILRFFKNKKNYFSHQKLNNLYWNTKAMLGVIWNRVGDDWCGFSLGQSIPLVQSVVGAVGLAVEFGTPYSLSYFWRWFWNCEQSSHVSTLADSGCFIIFFFK